MKQIDKAHHTESRIYKDYIKRFFDIVLSIAVLPIFCILYIVIGIAIKIEDRGPIFYKAERIGKGGSMFLMYKFRSMKVGSPNILNSDGSSYNSSTDSRVTKVGKFIRETSLDEVAQVINVLKGEMSIIGPRASGYDALASYKDDEKDKMLVRPGISGYTQAYFRNNLGVREKRLWDAWYAHNVSFTLDMRVFAKTIVTVLKKDNVYTNSDSASEIHSNKETESNEMKEYETTIK